MRLTDAWGPRKPKKGVLRHHAPFKWFWESPRYMSVGGVVVMWGLIFVAVVIAVVGGSIAVSAASCGQKGDRYGATANYRFLTGCYVELPNGRMIPEDLYPPKHLKIEGVGGR